MRIDFRAQRKKLKQEEERKVAEALKQAGDSSGGGSVVETFVCEVFRSSLNSWKDGDHGGADHAQPQDASSAKQKEFWWMRLAVSEMVWPRLGKCFFCG